MGPAFEKKRVGGDGAIMVETVDRMLCAACRYELTGGTCVDIKLSIGDNDSDI